METKPLVYLACPYTDENPAIMEWRYLRANKEVAKLTIDGEVVFSPLSHFHVIARDHWLPKDWKFWEHIDRAYMECCHKMYVLKLPGWQESVGVSAEIEIATELGIPIEFLEVE